MLFSDLLFRRGYSFKFEQLSDSISEQGKTGDKYWCVIIEIVKEILAQPLQAISSESLR